MEKSKKSKTTNLCIQTLNNLFRNEVYNEDLFIIIFEGKKIDNKIELGIIYKIEFKMSSKVLRKKRKNK